MWQIQRTEEEPGTLLLALKTAESESFSFGDAITLWRQPNSEGMQFRLFTSLTLASVPFPAFRFETPSLTRQGLAQPFQFAIVNDQALERQENGRPFQEHFDANQERLEPILVFPNRGRDATMIVPHPTGITDVNHCHLGSFLRTADQRLIDLLWQAVGKTMHNRVNDKPVWLSTAGGGVPWLHVRLDDQPKYYRYQKFKSVG